jgi:hypothetical protein
VHTTIESDKKPKLTSVLEQNSLDEFVSLAQLSKKQFEAERGGSSIVVSGNQVIAAGQHQMIGQFVDNQGKTHAGA